MAHTHRTLFACLLSASLAAMPLALFASAPRSTWSMPTVQDIKGAMGPDAKGLALDEDHLPDLFDLTASRLEENPKNFTVVEPYTEGRWLGGRAVIEFARDLSYTLVSVYDKAGRRQRIYSVIARPREASAVDVARAEHAARTGVGNPVDLEAVAVEEVDVDAAPAPSKSKPDSRRKESKAEPKAEPKPSSPAVPAAAPEENVVMVDADAVTPTKRSGAAPETKKSKRDKRKESETAPATAPTQVAMATPSPEPVTHRSSVWMPSAATTPSPAPTKRSAEPATPATPSSASDYVWDESQGAYVPAKGAAKPAAAPAPERSASAPESAPRDARKKKGKKGEHKEAPAQAAPVPVAVEPVSMHPAPESRTPTPSAPSAKPGNEPVPSTEELLAEPTLVDVPVAASTSEPKSKKADKRKWKEPKASKAEPEAPAVVDVEPVGAPAKPASSNVWATPPAAAPSKPVVTQTPSELAALEAAKEKYKAPTSAHAARTVEPPVEVVETPVVETPVKPVSTLTPSERAALEEAKRAKEAKSRPAEPVAKAPVKKPSGPSVEDLLVNAGPDTAESDRWVPKKMPQAAPVEEVPPPTQVASVPKAKRPAESSIDDLLRVAEQNQKAVGAEGDAWVPKPVALPKADADVVAELNRVRNQKPAEPARPRVVVRKDINNPEEGVLPVNSFEKFSGPRYGRHREYERRFYYGKKPKATVQDYDFYVDEVDRKKEIHNVYYYKKGKAPKLVAVERHSKVTFKGNYDIEKEDSGKVSTY